jgi:hypothetical protein
LKDIMLSDINDDDKIEALLGLLKWKKMGQNIYLYIYIKKNRFYER